MISPRLTVLAAATTVAFSAFSDDPGHPALAKEPERPTRPSQPKVSKVTAAGMTVRWRKVAGASYIVFGNGAELASTRSARATLTGLRCGKRYRIAVAAVSLSAGQSSQSKAKRVTTKPCPGFAGLLRSDMKARSESLPHGMDKLPFSRKPRLGAGINAGHARAFTAWGQLYECKAGNKDPAARVEIGDIRAWIKSKRTGSWSRIQASPGVDGRAYREDFANDESDVADVRWLPSGAVSAVAGNGRNFHFWPQSNRESINPSDIAGVITVVRARLSPGATSRACYVLSMGADYWASANARWGSNKDVGIGRFKRVDSNWRLFTMSTTSTGVLPGPLPASAQELR